MTDDATPREVGSHAGLGLAPERAEVERLAVWMERAAWIDAAHSYHEYEQTAKALRALQAALDAAAAAERERCVAAIRAAHDDGDASGIERDVSMWNKAVAHCLSLVLGPNAEFSGLPKASPLE